MNPVKNRLNILKDNVMLIEEGHLIQYAKEKGKNTNNDLHNTTQKTTD
jgi:hypothetical protein